MNPTETTLEPPPEHPLEHPHKPSEPYLTGFILVGLGALAFVAQLTDLSWLVLPALAALFFALGAWRRESSWFIPAGVLGGLSLGVGLLETSLAARLPGDAEGGVFMLAFALGWLSVPLATRLLGERAPWWPVIPAAVMALIGVTALGWPFGETLLRALGWLWPLGLVALGLSALLRRGAR